MRSMNRKENSWGTNISRKIPLFSLSRIHTPFGKNQMESFLRQKNCHHRDSTTLSIMPLLMPLSVNNRKITNTSARVLGFHTQENAGIDAVSGQVFTGHIAPTSAVFYRRNNQDSSNKVGAALASCVTGSAAVVPESTGHILTKDLLLNRKM